MSSEDRLRVVSFDDRANYSYFYSICSGVRFNSKSRVVLRLEPDSDRTNVQKRWSQLRTNLRSEAPYGVYSACVTDGKWWRNGCRRAFSDGIRSTSNRRQVILY